MRTTWWRRSSRPSPGRCARRSRSPRGTPARCPRRRACSDGDRAVHLGRLPRRRGRAADQVGRDEVQRGRGRGARGAGRRGWHRLVAAVMTKVVVLDYGSGNLRSAERAVARTGVDVTVTSDLDAAAAADGLFVPGVGAYAACMAGIEELGAGPMIADRVRAKKPVLGVCVGMQIFFDSGVEHGVETKGLGLLPGVVTKLHAERIPHMGWNTVDVPDESLLFQGTTEDTRFYFVHSYAASDLDVL